MLNNEKPANPEGWAFTAKSRKAHYFRHRHTLCSSRLVYTGMAYGTAPANIDDRCEPCDIARERERVAELNANRTPTPTANFRSHR